MLKKNEDELVFKLRDPGSLHRIKGAEPEEQVRWIFIRFYGILIFEINPLQFTYMIYQTIILPSVTYIYALIW